MKGGGGGALDRVEEGGGPADCTDGGDGGVGAGALLGHARQAKVRNLAAHVRAKQHVARGNVAVDKAPLVLLPLLRGRRS